MDEAMSELDENMKRLAESQAELQSSMSYVEHCVDANIVECAYRTARYMNSRDRDSLEEEARDSALRMLTRVFDSVCQRGDQ